MKIKVLKFGGSSVETLEKMKFVARKIIDIKSKSDDALVIVLSAMGKTTKNLYDNARMLAKNPRGRDLDLLLSTGEIVSISYLSIILNQLGCNAIALTGIDARIYTKGDYQNSKIDYIDTSVIKKHLDEGKVVIVAGYQGVNSEGYITTLGKEGSDTTAINLAYYLNADCIIYTDVSYVYEVDPRIVYNPAYHDVLSFSDLFLMSSSGAKVVAKSAISFALENNVEFKVMPTFFNSNGTTITNTFNKDFVGIGICENVRLLSKDIDNSKLEELIKKGVSVEDIGSYYLVYLLDYYSYELFEGNVYNLITFIGEIFNDKKKIDCLLNKIFSITNSIHYSYHKDRKLSICINESSCSNLINIIYKYIKEELLCERLI